MKTVFAKTTWKKEKKETSVNKRKRLMKDCDSLVSLIVRARDKKCVCCGSTVKLTNGHLITRACKNLLYSLINCNCQCWGCNFVHEFRPERYTAWWIKHYGMEAYENLVAQSWLTKKWTIDELEVLKVNLTDIYKEMK